MTWLIAKTRTRLLAWGFLRLVMVLALGVGAGFVIAFALEAAGLRDGIQRGFILAWGLVFAAVFVVESYGLVRAFYSQQRLCTLIESVHPEYKNVLSTLHYLDSHPEEVETLGYSPDLAAALGKQAEALPEPKWERLGLTLSSRRGLAIGAAIGVVSFLVVAAISPKGTRDYLARVLFGEGPAKPLGEHALLLPESIEVPIHHEVIVPSTKESVATVLRTESLPAKASLILLAREKGGHWKSLGELGGSKAGPKEASPVRFRVEGEMEVCAIADGLRSNACKILPVYPPAVERLDVAVKPPAYTRFQTLQWVSPERIEALTGSVLDLKWTSNNTLAETTLEVLSETGEVRSTRKIEPSGPKTADASLALVSNGSLRLRLVDRFGQTGASEATPFFALEDRVPALDILSPSREVVLSGDLKVPIKLLATDDVAVADVWLVHRIEAGVEGGGTEQGEIRRAIYQAAQGGIPSASTVVCSPSLDLSESNLWPGDRVSYWIEASDWRGPDRPGKTGRSEIHTARFPSVDETLEERASMRAETTDRFQDLLQEQKEITRQFSEMRQDIQSNQKEKQKSGSAWENKKKLAETVKRQEEVQKKIADVAQQFEQSLQRLEEQNDVSLRTLQKFEKVQDLLDQLLSEESKQTLKELRETLRKLEENQLRPEELDKTEQNLADFERQLDRQLALLENMWLEQQIEELQKQTEEVAQRQEELRQSTEDLAKEKQPDQMAEDDGESEDAELPPDTKETLETQVEKLAEKVEQAKEEAREAKAPEETKETAKEPEKPSEQLEEQAQKKEDAPSEEEQAKADQQPESQQAPKEEPHEDQVAKEEGLGDKEQKEKHQESSEEGLKEKQEESSEQTAQEEAISPEEDLLADRQEQINKDTESLLDELKRLEEKAGKQQSQLAQSLSQVNKSSAGQSASKNQKEALSKLKSGQTKQACKKQSQAKKDLDKLASGLSKCCSGKDMEEQIAKMKEILERAFLLSEEAERNDQETARYRPLPAWPNPDRMAKLGREMGLYRMEASRLSADYTKVSQKNPFADFGVVRWMDQAARNWKENTQVMEESSPMAVSFRSHQAEGYVNLSIEKLLQSINQSQSQSQSSGGGAMDNYFKSLKKMLSEQKSLNRDTQGMKEQMSQGERLPNQSPQEKEGGVGEQMRKMAEQQRSIRRQLEQLEKQYSQMKQRTGGLDGVGEMMQDVEKDLKSGQVNDQVTELQNKIEQRLLDAEKSLHEKGYKKKRKALRAEGEAPEGVEEEAAPLVEEQQEGDLARLLRDNLEQVSPHWRDRVRSYYDNLLRMNP
jgi:hypothetical protein